MKNKYAFPRVSILAAFTLAVVATPGRATIGEQVLQTNRESQGQLLIGTESAGMNRFMSDEHAFDAYRVYPAAGSSLTINGGRKAFEDPNGSSREASLEEGVCRRFRLARPAACSAFARIGGGNGSISTVVFRIAEGNEGLPSGDSDFSAPFQDYRRNRMYPSGQMGAVAFFPGESSANASLPGIAGSATAKKCNFFKLFTEETAPKVLFNSPDGPVTSDSFGLNDSSSKENHYGYQPMGFDPEWLEYGQRHRASRTGLPAGEYRCVPGSLNCDGTWIVGDSGSKLTFFPPLWWQPSWACVAFAAVLLAVLIGGWRRQYRMLEAEKAHSRDLEHEIEIRGREFEERYGDLLSINNRLRELCLRDPLTGLRNRRYLHEFFDTDTALFERSLIDSQNNTGQQAGLDFPPKLFFMMVDLDGFKTINDDYGHQAGDQALVQVSDVLRKCARRSDTVIRWGGDEFLLVGQCRGPLSAEKLAERVRSEIERHHYQVGNGYVSRLTASIGLSIYPLMPAAPNPIGWRQMVDIADQASYLAKQTRRNAWVAIYSTDKTMKAQPIRTLKIEIDQLMQQGVVEVKSSIEGDFAAAFSAPMDQAIGGFSRVV